MILKNILYLAAFSTFIVFVIIGMNIYRYSKESALKPITQVNIIEINNSFDLETLNSLQKRVVIPVNLSERTPISGIEKSDATNPPETSTGSAEINAEPTQEPAL